MMPELHFKWHYDGKSTSLMLHHTFYDAMKSNKILKRPNKHRLKMMLLLILHLCPQYNCTFLQNVRKFLKYVIYDMAPFCLLLPNRRFNLLLIKYVAFILVTYALSNRCSRKIQNWILKTCSLHT